MILNYNQPRYPLVSLAVNWAKVLEKKQEYHHLKRNEVLELALEEVLAGKVDKETILKAAAELKKQIEAAEAEEAAKAKESKKDKEEVKEPKEKETASKKK